MIDASCAILASNNTWVQPARSLATALAIHGSRLGKSSGANRFSRFQNPT
jgi:hypothetical protein